jgi:hypothetical protein
MLRGRLPGSAVAEIPECVKTPRSLPISGLPIGFLAHQTGTTRTILDYEKCSRRVEDTPRARGTPHLAVSKPDSGKCGTEREAPALLTGCGSDRTAGVGGHAELFQAVTNESSSYGTTALSARLGKDRNNPLRPAKPAPAVTVPTHTRAEVDRP